MNRDSRENTLDPVERLSPSMGDNGTGDPGDEEARILREGQDRGAEPGPDAQVKAPEADRAPGRGV